MDWTDPLLEPLTDANWPDSVAALRKGFAGKLNVYRLMAHHPALLAAWENFRNHIVLHSALPTALREIVILRVGFHWGAHYEWGQHVVRGREAGLSDVQIDNARRPSDQWRASAHDALAMRAVDDLLDEGGLSPEMVAQLEKAFGREASFDLLATVGMYTTLAFFVKSYRTPLEPDVAAAAAAFEMRSR